MAADIAGWVLYAGLVALVWVAALWVATYIVDWWRSR